MFSYSLAVLISYLLSVDSVALVGKAGVTISGRGGVESNGGSHNNTEAVDIRQRSTLNVMKDIPPSATSLYPQIPKQLILTGRGRSSLEDYSLEIRSKIEQTLQHEPGMQLRWLNDRDCWLYLYQSRDRLFLSTRLFELFNEEKKGSRRGDICRTAVLFLEGGFYMDLDIELSAPLHELVDEFTTFMSVYESPGDTLHDNTSAGVLNALIAVEPKSMVMKMTISFISTWYRKIWTWQDKNRLGPWSLGQALQAVVSKECPSENITLRKQQFSLPNAPLQWNCGSHMFRMYMQKEVNCSMDANSTHCCMASNLTPEICQRAPQFDGMHYGLVKPGSSGALLGFPRPEGCDIIGCGLGGTTSQFWYEYWQQGKTASILHPVSLKEADTYFDMQNVPIQMKKKSTSKPTPRIPQQLTLIGRGRFESLPAMVQSKFKKLLDEPGFSLRWLSDIDCRHYITKYFSKEFKKLFAMEQHWAFRRDVCKTAVLLREGGFYTDLDVELLLPLSKLVDENTSFMSAYESLADEGGMLNAFMAVEPGSKIMLNTLFQMWKWYHLVLQRMGEKKIGPMTLWRGISATLAIDCPEEDLQQRKQQLMSPQPLLQWNCGTHQIRLYTQRLLESTGVADVGKEESSQTMSKSSYKGHRYGLFAPGLHESLIGFPQNKDSDLFE